MKSELSRISLPAAIEIIDINPYIHLSAARARRIKPDWRKPLPVLIRVDGQPNA